MECWALLAHSPAILLRCLQNIMYTVGVMAKAKATEAEDADDESAASSAASTVPVAPTDAATVAPAPAPIVTIEVGQGARGEERGGGEDRAARKGQDQALAAVALAATGCWRWHNACIA